MKTKLKVLFIHGELGRHFSDISDIIQIVRKESQEIFGKHTKIHIFKLTPEHLLIDGVELKGFYALVSPSPPEEIAEEIRRVELAKISGHGPAVISVKTIMEKHRQT